MWSPLTFPFEKSSKNTLLKSGSRLIFHGFFHGYPLIDDIVVLTLDPCFWPHQIFRVSQMTLWEVFSIIDSVRTDVSARFPRKVNFRPMSKRRRFLNWSDASGRLRLAPESGLLARLRKIICKNAWTDSNEHSFANHITNAPTHFRIGRTCMSPNPQKFPDSCQSWNRHEPQSGTHACR